MNDLHTLSVERVKELLRAELQLDALLDYGVDNWQGWDDAMEIYRERLTKAGFE